VTNPRYKKRWEARICIDKELRTVGRFSTPEEAARKYDEVAVQLFGQAAITNASLGLL
jgi:hypothetical protein